MTVPPTVCVVVLNWNQPVMTLDCVACLAKTSEPGESSVLVVDNGSEPGNLAALQSALPAGCGFIRTGRNLGYAGGMNVGVRHALAAGFEYVWLLNNDAFPDPACLRLLVQALAADPRLGAVTPLLYGRDGAEQHAGARLDWATADNRARYAADLAVPTDDPAVWLTGTALLARASVFRTAGLFDEKYFAYWEDVDWCLRVRRAGYRLRALPAARCLHYGSASTDDGGDTPFSIYMLTRNGYRFFAAHPDRRGRVGRLACLALRTLTRVGDEYEAGRVRRAVARVAGSWAALSREAGPARRFGSAGPVVRAIAWLLARVPWRTRRWVDRAIARRAAGG